MTARAGDESSTRSHASAETPTSHSSAPTRSNVSKVPTNSRCGWVRTTTNTTTVAARIPYVIERQFCGELMSSIWPASIASGYIATQNPSENPRPCLGVECRTISMEATMVSPAPSAETNITQASNVADPGMSDPAVDRPRITRPVAKKVVGRK